MHGLVRADAEPRERAREQLRSGLGRPLLRGREHGVEARQPAGGQDARAARRPSWRRRRAADARSRSAASAAGTSGKAAKAIAATSAAVTGSSGARGRADGAAHDVAAVGAQRGQRRGVARPGAGWRGRTRSPRGPPRAPSPRRTSMPARRRSSSRSAGAGSEKVTSVPSASSRTARAGRDGDGIACAIQAPAAQDWTPRGRTKPAGYNPTRASTARTGSECAARAPAEHPFR